MTGASSGIGLATAVYLQFLGYTVFGTSRNPKRLNLEELEHSFRIAHTKYKFANKKKSKLIPTRNLIPSKIETQLPELLSKIKFYQLDISDNASVSECIHSVLEDAKHLGRSIDILINNAGWQVFRLIEDHSIDQAKLLFNTNFWGPSRLIRAILPYMIEKQAGQIINITSLAGLHAGPFWGYYAASKAALMRITESLYIELKRFNIKVSSIEMGSFNTNLTANSIYNNPTDPNKKIDPIDLEKMVELVPLSSNSKNYDIYKTAWEIYTKILPISLPPLVAAKKIASVIKSKKVKVHYQSASRIQRLWMMLMRRVLSDNIAMRIYARNFKL